MAQQNELVNVLTNRNDNARTGAYLHETSLNTENVGVATFGRLFSRTVDGDLYAQPLVVSEVKLGKGDIRNIVFLATSRNWVYAYDAVTSTECLPLWQVNLGTPVARVDIFKDYANFASEIGITSTPVIDLRKNGEGVLYVVAKTCVRGSETPEQKGFEYTIHALDIKTGKPFRFRKRKGGEATMPGAVKINAKARDPESGREVKFDAKWQLNRPGLLLLDGKLYIAFGSHGDVGQFWGWIMAYDAETFEQLAVHCTALAWGEGGIWQSGCAMAGESVRAPDGTTTSYIYAVVGNGQKPIPDIDDGPVTHLHTIPDAITAPFYGNSILKLTLVRTAEPPFLGRPPRQGDPHTPFQFEIVDWFTASNCLDLNENDEDFIGGPVLFSAQGKEGKPLDMVLGGGKDGKFYLADRNNLGKWQPIEKRDPYKLIWWDPVAKQNITTTITLPYQVTESDVNAHKHWVRSEKGKPSNQIIQDDRLCNYHIHGAPVLWKQSDTEVRAYVWSEKDFCKALSLENGQFRIESTSLYGFPSRELRMPGGILALSSDGTKDGTGIIWASHPTDDDGMNKTVRGTLRAFDARDLNFELWNSDKNPDGDDRLGDFAKFCPPVVANGKVYMATFSRELVVYGLLKDVNKDRSSGECDIWKLQGIGTNVHGSCKFSCERYTISTTGNGFATPADPADSADSFYFPHVEIDSLEQSEISITAHVRGISILQSKSDQQTDVRVGVMIRAFDEQDKLAKVPYAAMVCSPLLGTLFVRRVADNVKTIQDGPIDVFCPTWLRLICRSGEIENFVVITGEISENGLTWQQLGALAKIEMSGRLMVGLVATVQAGLTNILTPVSVQASFSEVVVTPQIT